MEQCSKRETIALNMIVKNSGVHLQKTLDSIERVGFDEIVIVDTGSTDNTVEIAKRYGANVKTYTNYEPVTFKGTEYLSDFAGARNYARICSSTDFIFYLDCDDLVSNQDGLKAFFDAHVRTGQIDGARFTYDYEHDEYGNCSLRHQTLRLARRLQYHWLSPIHEVLCSVANSYNETVNPEICYIKHDSPIFDTKEKSGRNAAVAKYWIDKDGPENTEARLWLNYGKSLISSEDYDEALKAFQKYLDGSSRNDERYFVYCLRGNIYREKGLFEDAFKEYLGAVRLYPRFSDAYLELAKTHVILKKYDDALFYCDMYEKCDPIPYQSNPLSEASAADKVRIYAYMGVGDFTAAVKCCDNVLDVYPWDKSTRQEKVICVNSLREAELEEAYRKLEFMLVQEGSKEKIKSLSNALPRALESSSALCVPVAVDSSRPRVGIFCGETAETWGHDSVKTGGIGGSETAVIYMAQELVALGWNVEVYGYPSEAQEGKHNGVTWLPWWRFENCPDPDVMVLWRTPGWMESLKSCSNKYIWLHDVQYRNRWSSENWEEANGVLCLSKAHAKTAQFVPEDKIWYSANGLDTSFHRDGDNKSTRLIYASGPDRGLDLLLNLWPKIKEAVPEAEIDIYYGFTPLFMETVEKNEAYRKIYDDVIKGISQPGVHWHGRVDQDELAVAFANAGIWAYPTSFPEISCITAMQAQANGAVPVCTGYAALSETVQHGIVIGGSEQILNDSQELEDQWLSELISLMKDPDRQVEIRKEMIPWARKTFLWSKVAEDWSNRFKTDLDKGSSTITPQPITNTA